MLPTTQFAYRKSLDTCDAILCVSHTLQSALEMGQEARIFQIDFSAAVDRVNHQGILFKLCSVGVGGSVLSVPQFLSNRSQYVVVDGCCSKLVNVVSGVPQGSVLAPQLFLLYTTELFGVLRLPVLEYCSIVWCSAADSHRKLLGTVVRSAGGVLDCNLAHRRSVAELCMLFKIKRNPMHPLSGALPLPYVPARVTVVLWLLIGTPSCLLRSSSL